MEVEKVSRSSIFSVLCALGIFQHPHRHLPSSGNPARRLSYPQSVPQEREVWWVVSGEWWVVGGGEWCLVGSGLTALIHDFN